jgi:hypothetical protein
MSWAGKSRASASTSDGGAALNKSLLHQALANERE